jgi:hypothetical protein
MPKHNPSDETPRRSEVETISLRLPKHLVDSIREHCANHADNSGVLGMQAPTISSVIRQLVEERFDGPGTGKRK